ncbi:MAG: hypothetical protein CME64_13310 [Halobacteriovoraceae bacterium]|nr:hypothetical protein [Halobacteriovoraceae bacterium]
MLRTWIVLPFMLFSLCALAAPEGLSKRFEFKRSDDGRLESVRMKFVTKNFSIAPYIKQIKEDIKSEIKRMRSKSLYGSELDEFLAQLESERPFDKNASENVGVIRDAIENLPNIRVDDSFEAVLSQGVLKKFEWDLKEALKMLDLAIVAYPNDARFFYRKNVTYQVVTKALEFAKKRFDSVPLLNLASFVIVQVHDMVLEQRTFHQNMLLHYIQNFKADELGLSKEEVDMILSSIYESRISAMNLPESNAAASNWTRYGVNKFFTVLRSCNTKIRRTSRKYDSVNERYNFAFVEVVEEGNRVVKNLLNNGHSFSSKASTAYDYSNPNKVRRFRALLNLGELGLGFLPIPGWIKSNVESFIESFYVEQRLTEGALVGYFESNGDMKMAKKITNQMSNPYLIFN